MSSITQKVDEDIVRDLENQIAEAEKAIAAQTPSKMSVKKMVVIFIVAIIVFLFLLYIFSPRVKNAFQRIEDKVENALSFNQDKKVVCEKELRTNESRFEFYFADYCFACKRFKPVLQKFIEDQSPSNFKIIYHDCQERTPENISCGNFATIPALVYRKNSQDSYENRYKGPANCESIAKWVKSFI